MHIYLGMRRTTSLVIYAYTLDDCLDVQYFINQWDFNPKRQTVKIEGHSLNQACLFYARVLGKKTVNKIILNDFSIKLHSVCVSVQIGKNHVLLFVKFGEMLGVGKRVCVCIPAKTAREHPEGKPLPSWPETMGVFSKPDVKHSKCESMSQKDAQVLNFQNNLRFPWMAVNVLEIKRSSWSSVWGISIKKDHTSSFS